jgi:isopentenyl-diphosphate delta-isomerase
MEKMEAHRQAQLHRAFSVFLYRNEQILMQKRAIDKYHCGGLWTNTCCSHPAPGERVLEAAQRRLMEEAGISAPELTEVDKFFYRYPFPNGITEFECDHVLIGEYDGDFTPDPEEIDEMAWVDIAVLELALEQSPEAFTPWFLICAPRVFKAIRSAQIRKKG